MSIMDSQLLFCEGQDITVASGATAIVSTNVVHIPQVTDHTGTSRNDRPFLGGGNCFNVVVEDTDVVGSGATLAITLYNHTASGSGTTSGNTTLLSETVLGAAGLPDGTQICCLPLPVTIIEPYLVVGIACTGANISAGAITAWIGPPIQQGGSHGAL